MFYQDGFEIAIDNIYNAGVEIVKGVLNEWNCTFKDGVKPSNYIGDVFGSLGGEPDFGPGSITDGQGVLPAGATGDLEKRGGDAAEDVKVVRAADIKKKRGLRTRKGAKSMPLVRVTPRA